MSIKEKPYLSIFSTETVCNSDVDKFAHQNHNNSFHRLKIHINKHFIELIKKQEINKGKCLNSIKMLNIRTNIASFKNL